MIAPELFKFLAHDFKRKGIIHALSPNLEPGERLQGGGVDPTQTNGALDRAVGSGTEAPHSAEFVPHKVSALRDGIKRGSVGARSWEKRIHIHNRPIIPHRGVNQVVKLITNL